MTFSKPTKENTLGADSPFTPVNFWCHQVTILKKHLDHLTRSFSHSTPRFMMRCMVTQINTQRNTSSPHFYRWKFVWLKGVFPVLRHCKETCWMWTWQLGFASKNSALILWKQDVSFSNPLRKTIWVFEKNTLGADSVFTTINFSGQCMPFLKKHCTWISLLGGLPIEHLGSYEL